jgi:hypothetical protein
VSQLQWQDLIKTYYDKNATLPPQHAPEAGIRFQATEMSWDVGKIIGNVVEHHINVPITSRKTFNAFSATHAASQPV